MRAARPLCAIRSACSGACDDGLKFHDGQPVRSADCIASLERWGKRDSLGQKLAQSTESWTAVNDKTFKLKLKKPFPLTLDALGKLSSNVPFIMPERIARTDAFQNITETIGSGPFKFVKDEWMPGSKVVYVKNTEYLPRKESPSWAAGGKVVKVDRVEWIYIPDSATAAAALNAGEADWWEQLPPDLIPLLRKNKATVVHGRGRIDAHLGRRQRWNKEEIMVKVIASSLRKGNVVEQDGNLHVILTAER